MKIKLTKDHKDSQNIKVCKNLKNSDMARFLSFVRYCVPDFDFNELIFDKDEYKAE